MLLMLILAACSGGGPAEEIYVGSNGLVIEFSPTAPPDTVYEGRQIPVKVLVHNDGASDIVADRVRVSFTGDPLYFSGGLVNRKAPEFDVGLKTIKGKENYPGGQDLIFSVPVGNIFSVKQLLGTREEPKTTMGASVCYPYTTTMTTQVCIDTSGSEGNLRAQPCEAKDITDAQGQGAPIAIAQIEVEALPIFDPLIGEETTQPQFTIHIRDMGGGRLIGPDTLDPDDACLLRNIPPSELGAVRIEAWLLTSKLDCLPGKLVPIFNGEGEAQCTVGANELANPVYSGKQNFVSTLTINLSYFYKTSVEKEITIRRTGSVAVPPNRTGIGKQSGYVYDGDRIVYQNGRPLTECEYYANNPDKLTGPVHDVIASDFSCACTDEQCTINANKITCLPNLCPGAQRCCAKKTASEPPV